MSRLVDLKILVLLLVLASCQKLKPESVAIPEYPDFEQLMTQQVKMLGQTKIKKEAWLEGKSEVHAMNMDSTKWAEELSFLKEINPNQPEYVGAFEKSSEGDLQILTLGAEENGALKKVKYSKSGENYKRIAATFHEDKDVYVHHREIEMIFENGILNSLTIDGYQKMMFKDTVRFRILLSTP
ncbi:hypothetical protein SAMN05421640_0309 [Ekhidna lutea]|uniref:Uncharacterized protein n=1 Tax=Ekhidna lutea TaxID=447679 RepID=A0A239ESE7_EKHLU|nr:hypothetical protein [Ekhidna lutea]SNS47680.1 hypothetical protein SAMN05421640_0309 [Ekhidna lutea]